jgi:hypothetical protein
LPFSVSTSVIPDDGELKVTLLSPRKLRIRHNGDAIEFSSMRKRWRFRSVTAPMIDLLNERRVCTLNELHNSVGREIDLKTCRLFLGELVINGLVTIGGD